MSRDSAGASAGAGGAGPAERAARAWVAREYRQGESGAGGATPKQVACERRERNVERTKKTTDEFQEYLSDTEHSYPPEHHAPQVNAGPQHRSRATITPAATWACGSVFSQFLAVWLHGSIQHGRAGKLLVA